MGIEKLYREDRPMTIGEVMSEAYNTTELQKSRSNLKDQPEFKIQEIKDENGKVTFKLVKEPCIKYYLMNINEVWKTHDECYGECLEKVTKHFIEIGEIEFLKENEDNHSEYYHSLPTEEKIKYVASEITDKKWKSSFRDIKVYKVKIVYNTEKEQISKIEMQNGFNGWILKRILKI